MITLKVPQLRLDLLKQHAEEKYPHECCGFLLGNIGDKSKEVVLTLQAENAREEQAKHHRFLITPEAFMRCEKFARKENLEILGFYHSHPNAEARPSDYDREHAWPWYSYLIVSVLEEGAKEATSWVLQDDRSKFNQESIELF